MTADENKLCRELCRESVLELVAVELKRIDAILDEREKATVLLASNEVAKKASGMMREYVLRENYNKDIEDLQEQITGPLGLELRMRNVEQSKGVVDAKLYMVIIGVPIVITALTHLFLVHLLK